VTEGGADEAGVFHKIPRIDDSRLAEIFAREVLSMLVRKELLSPEWAERILSWRHTGFNVHSRIFIARVTSHIPDKGQVMVRYYGLYANAHIYRSSEADVRGGEAPAVPCFYRGRPDGGRFGLYSWRRVCGSMSAAEECGEYC
jgi:hypothetical protein